MPVIAYQEIVFNKPYLYNPIIIIYDSLKENQPFLIFHSGNLFDDNGNKSVDK